MYIYIHIIHEEEEDDDDEDDEEMISMGGWCNSLSVKMGCKSYLLLRLDWNMKLNIHLGHRKSFNMMMMVIFIFIILLLIHSDCISSLSSFIRFLSSLFLFSSPSCFISKINLHDDDNENRLMMMISNRCWKKSKLFLLII